MVYFHFIKQTDANTSKQILYLLIQKQHSSSLDMKETH